MDISTLKNKYLSSEAGEKSKEFEGRLAKAHETKENASYLSSELAYWSTLSQKISEILKKIGQYEETQNLLKDADEDMKELANNEILKLEEDISRLEEEITKIQIERKFHDVDDNKPGILEIRAGAGGEEASLFAADIFRMYKNYEIGRASCRERV